MNIHSVTYESAVETVALFSKDIKEKGNRTQLKAAGAGCTGFTFLCSIQDESVSKNFVLKRITKLQAENEQLCSTIFQRLGLNAPFTCILEKESITPHIQSQLERERPAAGAFDPEQHSFLYMERCPGKTFNDFFNEHVFADLAQETQTEIFQQIGQATVFDLAIGNNDRFISPSDNGLGSHHFNAGNLLLNARLIEGQLHLDPLYFIDNATNASLEGKRERPVEDFVDIGNLFGDEETEDEIEDIQIATPIPIEEKMRSFQEATNRCLENPDRLASHVYEGIRAHLSIEASEQDRLIRAISQGIVMGFVNLEEKKSHIYALDRADLGEFSKRTIEIFRSTVQQLTNTCSLEERK